MRDCPFSFANAGIILDSRLRGNDNERPILKENNDDFICKTLKHQQSEWSLVIGHRFIQYPG
jgi:hypothetical protein